MYVRTAAASLETRVDGMSVTVLYMRSESGPMGYIAVFAPAAPGAQAVTVSSGPGTSPDDKARLPPQTWER